MEEEQALWRAVLLQTFEDVAGKNELNRRTAEAWFESKYGTTFADFSQVCDNAGYEVSTVQKVYQQFKEQADLKAAFKELRKQMGDGD